jgi:uncharacterized protein
MADPKAVRLDGNQTLVDQALSEKLSSWNDRWLFTVRKLASEAMKDADPGHGIEHVERVFKNACELIGQNPVSLDVLLPAIWLHDCVPIAKNSPLRSQASRLCAKRAIELLASIDYPSESFPGIEHAIAAHSFSANIPCESDEAKILQDADRLEGLGAIGLARCLMTGGSMGQRLVHPTDPFPTLRTPEDNVQSVDHFYAKLFRLPSMMNTPEGRTLAESRCGILITFLRQLAEEMGVEFDQQHAQSIIEANANKPN